MVNYKKKLIKGINESQASIDLLIQVLNQARQKLTETRIKVDNDQLSPKELFQILDELIVSLLSSSRAEQEIPGIIKDLHDLQDKVIVK